MSYHVGLLSSSLTLLLGAGNYISRQLEVSFQALHLPMGIISLAVKETSMAGHGRQSQHLGGRGMRVMSSKLAWAT